MTNSDYRQLEVALHDLGVDLHPSELHGMLVGYLCARKDASESQRAALYADWLGDGVPLSVVELLESLFEKAAEALDEYADFDFRLLTPDTDEAIGRRVDALADWCSGFLSGMGEAGTMSPEALEGDVAEALQDMAKIAALSEEVPEGEENEADLMEIEEFVRVSALLIYAETKTPGRH